MKKEDLELYREREQWQSEIRERHLVPQQDEEFSRRVMERLARERRESRPVRQHSFAAKLCLTLCRLICSPVCTALVIIGCLGALYTPIKEWLLTRGAELYMSGFPSPDWKTLLTYYISLCLLLGILCYAKYDEINESQP